MKTSIWIMAGSFFITSCLAGCKTSKMDVSPDASEATDAAILDASHGNCGIAKISSTVNAIPSFYTGIAQADNQSPVLVATGDSIGAIYTLDPTSGSLTLVTKTPDGSQINGISAATGQSPLFVTDNGVFQLNTSSGASTHLASVPNSDVPFQAIAQAPGQAPFVSTAATLYTLNLTNNVLSPVVDAPQSQNHVGGASNFTGISILSGSSMICEVGAIEGCYQINGSNLNLLPFWSNPALAAQEAPPVAIAQAPGKTLVVTASDIYFAPDLTVSNPTITHLGSTPPEQWFTSVAILPTGEAYATSWTAIYRVYTNCN